MRSRAQRDRDRITIAQRYLRGEPQHQIAAALGISRQQVGYELARIREEWRQSAIRDLDAHKAEELAKIDQLESTYWEAWQRSLLPLEITSTEKSEDDVQLRAGHAGRKRLPAKRTRMRASKRTEEQGGNPAYLAGIAHCIELRCRILGLNAATNLRVDGSLTFDQLYNLAQQADDGPKLRVLPPPADADV